MCLCNESVKLKACDKNDSWVNSSRLRLPFSTPSPPVSWTMKMLPQHGCLAAIRSNTPQQHAALELALHVLLDWRASFCTTNTFLIHKRKERNAKVTFFWLFRNFLLQTVRVSECSASCTQCRKQNMKTKLWLSIQTPVSFRCFISYGISNILLSEISHYALILKDCIHPPLQLNLYPNLGVTKPWQRVGWLLRSYVVPLP